MRSALTDPLTPREGFEQYRTFERVIRLLKSDWATSFCEDDDFEETCISCRASRAVKDLEYINKEILDIIEFELDNEL